MASQWDANAAAESTSAILTLVLSTPFLEHLKIAVLKMSSLINMSWQSTLKQMKIKSDSARLLPDQVQMKTEHLKIAFLKMSTLVHMSWQSTLKHTKIKSDSAWLLLDQVQWKRLETNAADLTKKGKKTRNLFPEFIVTEDPTASSWSTVCKWVRQILTQAETAHERLLQAYHKRMSSWNPQMSDVLFEALNVTTTQCHAVDWWSSGHSSASQTFQVLYQMTSQLSRVIQHLPHCLTNLLHHSKHQLASNLYQLRAPPHRQSSVLPVCASWCVLINCRGRKFQPGFLVGASPRLAMDDSQHHVNNWASFFPLTRGARGSSDPDDWYLSSPNSSSMSPWGSVKKSSPKQLLPHSVSGDIEAICLPRHYPRAW